MRALVISVFICGAWMQGSSSVAQQQPAVDVGVQQAAQYKDLSINGAPRTISGFRSKDVIIADDAVGTGRRKVPASSISLPAKAHFLSDANYVFVSDKIGLTFWVSRAQILPPIVTDKPIDRICRADVLGARGSDDCRN